MCPQGRLKEPPADNIYFNLQPAVVFVDHEKNTKSRQNIKESYGISKENETCPQKIKTRNQRKSWNFKKVYTKGCHSDTLHQSQFTPGEAQKNQRAL